MTLETRAVGRGDPPGTRVGRHSIDRTSTRKSANSLLSHPSPYLRRARRASGEAVVSCVRGGVWKRGVSRERGVWSPRPASVVGWCRVCAFVRGERLVSSSIRERWRGRERGCRVSATYGHEPHPPRVARALSRQSQRWPRQSQRRSRVVVFARRGARECASNACGFGIGRRRSKRDAETTHAS